MRTGDLIRQARQKAKLSQFKLAAAVGVTTNTILNIESGRTDPRVGTLRAIAREVRVPVHRLIGDD